MGTCYWRKRFSGRKNNGKVYMENNILVFKLSVDVIEVAENAIKRLTDNFLVT
jgi:hypothetical protein